MLHFPARLELEGKQHNSKIKYQRGQRAQCPRTCCLSLPTPTFVVVAKTSSIKVKLSIREDRERSVLVLVVFLSLPPLLLLLLKHAEAFAEHQVRLHLFSFVAAVLITRNLSEIVFEVGFGSA